MQRKTLVCAEDQTLASINILTPVVGCTGHCAALFGCGRRLCPRANTRISKISLSLCFRSLSTFLLHFQLGVHSFPALHAVSGALCTDSVPEGRPAQIDFEGARRYVQCHCAVPAFELNFMVSCMFGPTVDTRACVRSRRLLTLCEKISCHCKRCARAPWFWSSCLPACGLHEIGSVSVFAFFLVRKRLLVDLLGDGCRILSSYSRQSTFPE